MPVGVLSYRKGFPPGLILEWGKNYYSVINTGL